MQEPDTVPDGQVVVVAAAVPSWLGLVGGGGGGVWFWVLLPPPQAIRNTEHPTRRTIKADTANRIRTTSPRECARNSGAIDPDRPAEMARARRGTDFDLDA